MDVCSGAIHVVDDVTYDVIALYEEKNLEEIKKELSDTYNKEEIEEAYKEVTSLKEEGLKPKEIASKLDIPLRTVYYILNKK